MIVERLENWHLDSQNGFVEFGLPERKIKMAGEIEQGDTLITYVSSGVSAISDTRIVRSTSPKRLQLGGDYDTAFPIALETKPAIVLEQERWITFSQIASTLLLTSAKSDWRQTFRQSLIPLADADGKRLQYLIERASKDQFSAFSRNS
ncbi:hypothetical protein [Vannielia sp. SX4]|uniref:hypothetical protein n=1 Tax=Vannielia sp. SX4 TaxID=3463852 RepID=UPI004059D865